MNRPALLANPIMGLTSDRARVRDLLALHRHVYFSDLRDLSMAGATLTGRLFYGCLITPTTLAGATLEGARFVCCAGAGELAADTEVRRAVDNVLRGDWTRVWALLRNLPALELDSVEHLAAVAAVGMTDVRMEVRLSAMTLVARLLGDHPTQVPVDAREVLQAFLLYRAADDSDMVYYDAVALIDELKMPQSVLEHLVGRARSPDPRERVEALIARLRMYHNVHSTEPPYPPLAMLLDDDNPDVQLAMLRFLSQFVRYSWDAEELLPGVDLPEKLNPLLRSPDDRVRHAAVHYVRTWIGGPSNREALVAALQDSDEALRDVAFDALYRTLPEEELRDFLLHCEPTPVQRTLVLQHEARWREKGSISQIIDTPDLRTMLASDDPQLRRNALVLAGFTGDPALIPDAEVALGDPDPSIRVEAERLLPWLRGVGPNPTT